MDHFADERDFRLLEADRYTFAVLSRVLHEPCSCLLTDHERFILCHTVMPYPVWLWTPDDLTPAEKERVWQLASGTLSPAEGFRYNLKYDLAEYFIGRTRETGGDLRIATNMFAYDCPAAIAPEAPADGHLHICVPEDTDEAAQMIHEFHNAVAADQQGLESCRLKAAQHISRNAFFFWKDASGAVTACCSFNANGDLGCVGSVYTRPAFRRRHYAQHLVYQVTQLIAGQGLTPMLYTDADYAASNACYEKIGYVLRGKLCTIAAR